jgi:hypothetical protein
MEEGQVTEILDKQRGNTTQTPENRKKKIYIYIIISGGEKKYRARSSYTYITGKIHHSLLYNSL